MQPSDTCAEALALTILRPSVIQRDPQVLLALKLQLRGLWVTYYPSESRPGMTLTADRFGFSFTDRPFGQEAPFPTGTRCPNILEQSPGQNFVGPDPRTPPFSSLEFTATSSLVSCLQSKMSQKEVCENIYRLLTSGT
uniref:Uncharacterized protein n=1 Tax=Micrurus spixii TaxID=129469 RepID=A0A2D4M0H0_9SAUR